MKVLAVICPLVCLALARIEIGSKVVKPATFERYDGTCSKPNLPMTYEVHDAKMDGMKLWLNTTITIKTNIPTDLTVSINIKRCKNQENLDTCEPLHDVKSDRYCSYIEFPMWKSYFGTFTPPWKCPFKMGVYRGINSTVDMSSMLPFTSETWFWRCTCQLHQKRTNKLIMCLFMDVYLTYR